MEEKNYKILRREKRIEVKTKISEIKKTKKCLKTVIRLKKEFNPQVKMLLNENGELIMDKREIIKLLKNILNSIKQTRIR